MVSKEKFSSQEPLVRPGPTTSRHERECEHDRVKCEERFRELEDKFAALERTFSTLLLHSPSNSATPPPHLGSSNSTSLSSESHVKEAPLPPSLFPPSCALPLTPPPTPELPSSELPPTNAEEVKTPKTPVLAAADAHDVETSEVNPLTEWMRIDPAPLPSLPADCASDAVAAFAFSLYALLPELEHALFLEREDEEELPAPEFQSQTHLPHVPSDRTRAPPTTLLEACEAITALQDELELLTSNLEGALSDIKALQPTSKKLERQGATFLRDFVGTEGEYDALFRVWKDKVDDQKKREAAITTETATFVALCTLTLKILSTVATPTGAVTGLSTAAAVIATGITKPYLTSFCKIFERNKKEEDGKHQRRNRREAIARGEEAPVIEKELAGYKTGDRAGSWVKNVTAALPVAAQLVAVISTKLAGGAPA